MTHLNIADAVNDGIKKLLAILPSETAETMKFTEAQDIAICFNELTAICMAASVGDSEKTEALEEAYKNDSLTDANAVAKFLEAFIELHKKANPSDNAEPVVPVDPVVPVGPEG